MSRIDALIAELCPEGVESRAIGEFGELVRGNGMPKSDFVETGVGCIHYGQIYTFYGVWTTETKSFVPAEKAARLAKALQSSEKERDSLGKRLENPAFVEKAKPEAVEKAKADHAAHAAEAERLAAALARLG